MYSIVTKAESLKLIQFHLEKVRDSLDDNNIEINLNLYNQSLHHNFKKTCFEKLYDIDGTIDMELVSAPSYQDILNLARTKDLDIEQLSILDLSNLNSYFNCTTDDIIPDFDSIGMTTYRFEETFNDVIIEDDNLVEFDFLNIDDIQIDHLFNYFFNENINALNQYLINSNYDIDIEVFMNVDDVTANGYAYLEQFLNQGIDQNWDIIFLNKLKYENSIQKSFNILNEIMLLEKKISADILDINFNLNNLLQINCLNDLPNILIIYQEGHSKYINDMYNILTTIVFHPHSHQETIGFNSDVVITILSYLT
uniref:Uncharacterized protein n=2 Tax=Achlya hypogyna TaxID=1202772 RepID=S5TYW2_ACHHY|nr:hypothetical protein P239_p34 [Achlya hypogyna]AGS55465.1 hypothetical protein [Achlya hypogyna]